MAEIEKSNQSKAATIVKWMQDNAGFTIHGACGVAGNIYGESGFDQNNISDHGTSYGYCQWHNERWTALKKFAANAGKDQSDAATQLSFMVHELKQSYSSLFNTCKTSNNVTDVCRQWGHDYERFAGYSNYACAEYQRRIGYANAIYKGVTEGKWEVGDIGSMVGGSAGSSGAVAGYLTSPKPKPNIPPAQGTVKPEDITSMGKVTSKKYSIVTGTHIRQKG